MVLAQLLALLAVAAPLSVFAQTPVPYVGVSIPSDANFGTTVTSTFTFDNIATDPAAVGFGPFIDIIATPVVKTLGAATWNGLTLTSFQYKFTSNGECIVHPYLYQDLTPPGPPAPNNVPGPNKLGFICGNTNETFMSVLLPFSSYGPTAAPVAVGVPVTLASPGSGFVYANGGFNQGMAVVFDSIADPPIVGGGGTQSSSAWAGVGPIRSAMMLFEFDNDYDDVVGFGQSNSFNYTLDFGLAPGVTLSNGSASMALSNQVAFGGLYIVDPLDGVTKLICVPTTQTAIPPGCVAYTSVCGGCIKSIVAPVPCYPANCTGGAGVLGGGNVQILFNNITSPFQVLIGGVPTGFNSSGGAIDELANSNTVNSTSSVSIGGTTSSGGGGGGGVSQTVSVSKSSSIARFQIWLGKSAGVLVGGTQPIPGATLQFTLEVQVSQNHTYKTIRTVDYIRDGLDWNDTVAAPALLYAGRTIPIDVARFVTINRTLIGNDGVATDGTDGSTVVTFNVSGILLADNSSAVVLAGRTRLQVVYYTTIRSTYTDHTSAAGDRFVVPGDCLNNNAELYSDQVALTNTSLVLASPVRTAATQTGVPSGAFKSTLYAVNGLLCSAPANAALCSQVEYEALTQFTLHITYAMVTDAFRQLSIGEAFPIPLFDISTLTWPSLTAGVVGVNASANQCAGSGVTPPALGQMCFSSFNKLVSRNPTYTLNKPSMRWQLTYGTAGYTAATSAIGVLLTVNMTGIPWIDGFDVVTLEDKTENAASPCASLLTDFKLLRTRTPKMCITEGVVLRQPVTLATVTSYDARFTALTTTGAAFANTITQQGTGGNTLAPIGSVAPTDVQAGDRLRLAVLAVNQGRGTASNLQIVLNRNALYFTDPENVRVFTGANVAVTTATYSTATGVVSVPTLAGATSRQGTDTTGNNVLVIVYDVTVRDAFQPAEVATPLLNQLNVSLTQYTAGIATTNFVTTLHANGQYPASCLRADVDASGRRPVVAFDYTTADACTVEGTTPDIAVGEAFRLRTNITLPYGTLANANYSLTCTTSSVSAQFSLLNVTVKTQPATSSAGVTTASTFTLPANMATAFTIPFGASLTLPATATASLVSIEAWMRSTNSTAVSNGLSVAFSSGVTYTNPYVSPAAAISVATAPKITIRRQVMNVAGFTNFSASAPFEQFDTIRFCYNMTRSVTQSCGYNITVSIPIPPQLGLVANSATLVYSNGSMVAGSTVSSALSPVTATIQAVDKVVPASGSLGLMLCYNAVYLISVTGTTVTTTATVCTDTTPDDPTGAITCRTAPVDVTPRLAASIVGATGDPCTNDAQLIAHVGETVTLTNTVSLPRGSTPAVAVDVLWTSAAELDYVSSRIVSYGACLSPTNSTGAGTSGAVTAGQVRWYFGDLQRNTMVLGEPAGCGVIVVEVVTRVSTLGDTSVAVTGRITGASTTQSSSITYAIVGPTLTMASTLTPATGDAGDTAQYCFTLTNPNTAAATAACAYNVNAALPIPAGYTGAPTTWTFAKISPGETTTQACSTVTVTNAVLTSKCNAFVATATYNADDANRAVSQTVSSTQNYCTSAPTITASLTATNDSCTGTSLGSNTTIPDVQAGELVTYTIVVRLPEGVASPLTPQIVFDSRTTLVVGTPTVARVGTSLTAGTPTVSASATTVSWAFGSVSDTSNNVANVEDEIVLTVQARVLPTAPLAAVLTPTVTLVHAGTTLTAANGPTQAEVIEPAVTRSSSITPATGAYGDSVQVSFTVQQATSSSRCTYGIEVCDTPNSLLFNPATVVINGITPTPTIRTTSTGFCFTVPDGQTGAVTVTYNATFLDLPAGVDRCAVG